MTSQVPATSHNIDPALANHKTLIETLTFCPLASKVKNKIWCLLLHSRKRFGLCVSRNSDHVVHETVDILHDGPLDRDTSD
jgi:hypothetical protein